ncbi:proline-rich receptor-like protein kinase PERK8 [Salvia splendens]|uniref:proline-rich receptor-like protein kinase PERK8 n=1 Tax=Salvia splendens TaxID=180675 RepID=UPI001C252662|nr:proline-rich receptor-like protein kinase PERK8 [Salvia splendens]
MLLEQLPTSSSSSSSGADSEDQRTSPQAQIENPSPSSQPPPQASAAPPPEVDEEAVRSLDRILRSMPSGTDIPTVYATIKARLGISLSRDRATTPTPQNPPRHPPSTSQTQAPLHTPELTPAVPTAQYSGGDSEKEGVQPAATPAAETEFVSQPHAEGTAAPNAPTSPSGGGSSSSTLLRPTQPIEVVNIDDDSTEDFLPPPNEILQHRGTEWTFIP